MLPLLLCLFLLLATIWLYWHAYLRVRIDPRLSEEPSDLYLRVSWWEQVVVTSRLDLARLLAGQLPAQASRWHHIQSLRLEHWPPVLESHLVSDVGRASYIHGLILQIYQRLQIEELLERREAGIPDMNEKEILAALLSQPWKDTLVVEHIFLYVLLYHSYYPEEALDQNFLREVCRLAPFQPEETCRLNSRQSLRGIQLQAGTPVCLRTRDILRDPNLYRQALNFQPRRWQDPAIHSQYLLGVQFRPGLGQEQLLGLTCHLLQKVLTVYVFTPCSWSPEGALPNFRAEIRRPLEKVPGK